MGCRCGHERPSGRRVFVALRRARHAVQGRAGEGVVNERHAARVSVALSVRWHAVADVAIRTPRCLALHHLYHLVLFSLRPLRTRTKQRDLRHIYATRPLSIVATMRRCPICTTPCAAASPILGAPLLGTFPRARAVPRTPIAPRSGPTRPWLGLGLG